VVLEGPNGVGKSTLAEKLAEWFRAQGQKCESFSFPGREPGTLGEIIYRLHHNPTAFGLSHINEISLQALHVAAHVDVIQQRILPAIREGSIVILDRFWWSTWVYGRVSGIKRNTLRGLLQFESAAWGKTRPNLVVLLDRETPFAEESDLSTWSALRQEYIQLAKQEEKRYPVELIRNTESIEDTVDILGDRLMALCGHKDAILAHPAPQGVIPSSALAKTEHSYLAPIRPTIAYDIYWYFAAERQRIFLQRLTGLEPPWTQDPILSDYKFTNAYRASDRTSQFLIRHVIYRDDLPQDPRELFFRIILFKLFNKTSTWELLEKEIGPILWGRYSFEAYDQTLTQALALGIPIYSSAYIIPPVGTEQRQQKKHRGHLLLLQRMMNEMLPERIADTHRMQDGFTLLRNYPGIGDFLAYQFITDLNYSSIVEYGEMDFVVPGPGALNGILKCFSDLGGLSTAEMIRFVADRQNDEFERRDLEFQDLWGRSLQLIDCQNLFCEVDKYTRISNPELWSKSRRVRIKHRFKRTSATLNVWYPPKWGLNEIIAATENTRWSI